MPFAKYLYDAACKVWGWPAVWESLSSGEQEKWEEYARLCSAYFVP
jgi:hypothetical protein